MLQLNSQQKMYRFQNIWLVIFTFIIFSSLILVSCTGANNEQIETDRNLTLYSTTDTEVFKPIIEDFKRLYPNIAVKYLLMDAQPLYERVRSDSSAKTQSADIVLSSAMDLQVKLVNDGFAQPHKTENSFQIPSWANWRNEAFGVTFEPVVMVFNKHKMEGRSIPKTRNELLQDLRSDMPFWINGIGTYNIRESSVGYFLATQDARRSSEFGGLLELFGKANVQTSMNTASILDKIERGDLTMGYNLLGSYARVRIMNGAPLLIVYPQDYTLAVTRTAIILKDAQNPKTAHLFMEYLLSLRGQKLLSEQNFLNAVHPQVEGQYSQLGMVETQLGLIRPIALGPGLLVYLDTLKQKKFLATWDQAIVQSSNDTEPKE